MFVIKNNKDEDSTVTKATYIIIRRRSRHLILIIHCVFQMDTSIQLSVYC